jgi:hypothetical protein
MVKQVPPECWIWKLRFKHGVPAKKESAKGPSNSNLNFNEVNWGISSSLLLNISRFDIHISIYIYTYTYIYINTYTYMYVQSKLIVLWMSMASKNPKDIPHKSNTCKMLLQGQKTVGV